MQFNNYTAPYKNPYKKFETTNMLCGGGRGALLYTRETQKMIRYNIHTHTHTHTVSLIPPWEDQRELHRMTINRMTRPDCAVMCNLINTHTHTHTHTHTQGTSPRHHHRQPLRRLQSRERSTPRRKTPRRRCRAEEKQVSGLVPRYLLPPSSRYVDMW